MLWVLLRMIRVGSRCKCSSAHVGSTRRHGVGRDVTWYSRACSRAGAQHDTFPRMDTVIEVPDASDGSSKQAGFFLPEDLAAAFPRLLPKAGPWDRGRPANPTAPAPCTEDALLDALESYPTLRTLAKWQLALWWMPPTLPVRYTVLGAVCAAFCACVLVFNGGAFGARQLVGGYVLVAIFCAAFPAVWFAGQVVTLARGLPHLFPSKAAAARAVLRWSVRPRPSRSLVVEYVLSGYAMVPAWARSAKDGTASGTALNHLEGDTKCTCAAPRCSGALLSAAARHLVANLAAWLILQLAMFVSLGFTPLFSLPQVWTHAWSIFLGICFCLAALHLALTPFANLTPENMLLRLEGRIRRRLVRGALAAFLDRARQAVLSGQPFATPRELWGLQDEPYMQLHAELRPRWQQAVLSSNVPFVYPIFITLMILLMAASIIIGACIAAWMISVLALFVYFLLRDLWHAAVANSEIASLGELYSAALVETRDLLVSATLPSSVQPDDILLRHLAAHAAALELYAGEARGARRKFLGVAVGFGSFRGLLVSLATVTFAAWGLLRGFGVAATLETFCPG
ncbi:hypothetical protein DFJ74DRAFT_26269 [Hyaloraphidium curvatum]|nr:hypothetical protein DFJ74DRAFT_26269 [Hyaloraphidium curvatum]